MAYINDNNNELNLYSTFIRKNPFKKHADSQTRRPEMKKKKKNILRAVLVLRIVPDHFVKAANVHIHIYIIISFRALDNSQLTSELCP